MKLFLPILAILFNYIISVQCSSFGGAFSHVNAGPDAQAAFDKKKQVPIVTKIVNVDLSFAWLGSKVTVKWDTSQEKQHPFNIQALSTLCIELRERHVCHRESKTNSQITRSKVCVGVLSNGCDQLVEDIERIANEKVAL